MGILIIIGLLILIGIGIYVYVKNTTSNSDEGANYEANRTSTETNTSDDENTSDNENATNTQENTSSEENQTNTSDSNTTPAPQIVEEQLSTFSTKIYSNDSNRNKNMEITISTLNGTIVKNGETFSFNSIVGQPTAEKGYQEADVFIDQKTEKGYGGGNCQVSTTIYNTALNIDGLEIIERHPHKKKVSYIEEGKDAAVSYSGGLDLKFKNNTGYDIKIYVSSDDDSVDAKIVELQ